MSALMSPELLNWLERSCAFVAPEIKPLRADAGNRRYFRIRENDQSVVAMDASLDRASCEPFIAMAAAIRAKGLLAPDIFERDLQSGYLLISDFGDDLLLEKLSPPTADRLYGEALSALFALQHCETTAIPSFSVSVMMGELELFIEWYLQRHLSVDLSQGAQKMLKKIFYKLTESAASQPNVFMHRDYHSANLMVLPGERIGILDFQDACVGPVTYDLVSLLRDCYIDWPEHQVRQWVGDWHANSFLNKRVSQDLFMEWFDWMGVQRHLKATMIFARKWHRDHDSRYLQHIPRAMNYVFSVLPHYSLFNELHDFLGSVVNEICVG